MSLQILLILTTHPRVTFGTPLLAAAGLFAFGCWPERREQ